MNYSAISNQIAEAARATRWLANDAEILAKDVLDLFDGDCDVNQRLIVNKAASTLCRIHGIDPHHKEMPKFRGADAETFRQTFYDWLDAEAAKLNG